MTIWIDGDACPKSIKEIVFRAASKRQVQCIIVANSFIPTPSSPFIRSVQVEGGFDKADDKIAQEIEKHDLVVTNDLPLAEDCLQKGAIAISTRGEQFHLSTIKQKLAMRDFNEVMRGSGLHSGGPKPISARNVNQFANQLDSILTRQAKR